MFRSTLTGSAVGGTGAVEDLTESVDDHGREIVVVRWCGLKHHNAVGRFSSLASASEVVRSLSAIGITPASLSTAALVTDSALEALIGAHSNDESLVDLASKLMRGLGGRTCYFPSWESG